MDIGQIITTVAPIAVTAASAYIVKGLSKSHKYVILAADAVNALKDIQASLEDGSLSPDEIVKLEADIEQFEKDLKA